MATTLNQNRRGAPSSGRQASKVRSKMTAIEKIESKLQRWPSLRHSIDGNTITVESDAADSFAVWLTENQSGFTVGFDGWHEEFEKEDEALETFAFGLSDDCRLKVIRRGNMDCAWIVQGKGDDGEWRGDSTTGLLLTPFWRRRNIVYRQNRIITESEQEEADRHPTAN